ncbi:hypothetical protein Emag_000718 [Eimeria magna]
MDAVGESDKQPTRESELSLNQKIAGEFADVRLLNQLSITHLARWLKFHISILEPDRRFTTNVLLQMMRSVRHVIDKADWEPLIADLLQSNVRPVEESTDQSDDSTRLWGTKAAECGSAMRDLIFEQTHAIHFEMIEDLFDGCQQFEKDFLGSSAMREVAASVRSSMARRKQRLGIADVYARNAATGDPHDMIYEEV